MNKIQNKIYEYHATIINDPELAKRNHEKMMAMAKEYGDFFFAKMSDLMDLYDFSYQFSIDDCWEFFKMEEKHV